jgi:hypothetical protein
MFIGCCLTQLAEREEKDLIDTLANVGRGTAARVASQPRRRRCQASTVGESRVTGDHGTWALLA